MRKNAPGNLVGNIWDKMKLPTLGILAAAGLVSCASGPVRPPGGFDNRGRPVTPEEDIRSHGSAAEQNRARAAYNWGSAEVGYSRNEATLGPLNDAMWRFSDTMYAAEQLKYQFQNFGDYGYGGSYMGSRGGAGGLYYRSRNTGDYGPSTSRSPYSYGTGSSGYGRMIPSQGFYQSRHTNR